MNSAMRILQANAEGRLTLNPLKHIDPLGFIMLLVAGFGWAKPVQFDEKNLKNPKTDVMKIAIAGPLSNALTAMILSIIYLLFVDRNMPGYHKGNAILSEIFMYGIYINWGLMVFNLIPIPPLDGSHLLLNWFRKYPSLYAGLYKYGTLALFGLLIVSAIAKINVLPIWPLIEFLGNGFLSLFSFL
jgi:Zn-dependent protease